MSETNRRASRRTAARLHPGKLVDTGLQYLRDCAILDRSEDGARIGLFEAASLPEAMTLLDEVDMRRRSVRLVWQSGPHAGLRFEGEPILVEPREAERLAGRYYAVR